MENGHGNEQPQASSVAQYRHLVARLPLTIRPSLNQQLARWEVLFPFEQKQLYDFLHGVESLTPSELETLTRPLRKLEERMGVDRWKFSEEADTLENASQLARSEYYAEWRRAVDNIFRVVNAAAHNSGKNETAAPRLILLILPKDLPLDPSNLWQEWGAQGSEIRIEGDSGQVCELVMQGQSGVPDIFTEKGNTDASDYWLIDADLKLNTLVPGPLHNNVTTLSYTTLRAFRDKFLADLNTIPRSIEVSDQTIAELRSRNWSPYWPPELATQKRLQNFIIDLCLSGNGALIFSSAFVEWAASEAIRRSRPRIIIGRFGMRSKPKPFTSIAIFENQQRISTLPDVDDPGNSAIDGMILAHYVWLAAYRYPERIRTYCLCVSESSNSAYLLTPEGKVPDWEANRPVTPEEIHRWLGIQLAS